MKIAIQSMIFSFAIHLIYIIGMMIIGYIKTRNYQPDLTNTWGKVEMFQNEVAFGTGGSPLIFLFTIIGVALISGFIIFSYRKIVGLK